MQDTSLTRCMICYKQIEEDPTVIAIDHRDDIGVGMSRRYKMPYDFHLECVLNLIEKQYKYFSRRNKFLLRRNLPLRYDANK